MLASLLPRITQTLMRGLNTVDQVLRRGESGESEQVSKDPSTSQPLKANEEANHSLPVSRVVLIVFVSGPLYGFVMGSYAWVIGQRTFLEQVPQMVCSGIKVPLLILVTLVVSLPSFFVINTLLGLRDDFRESMRAIVSAQAGLTIILASLLPLTWFSYVSFATADISYQLAVMFNAAMFGLASVAAQVLLRGYYEPLIQKERRHQWMVRFWIFVYAFVGIQAGYILRPFIGDPNLPTTFLRAESFENAYVRIWRMCWEIGKSFF